VENEKITGGQVVDNIIAIIKRKPPLFLIISLGYLVLVGLIKWHISPPIGALWFLLGGAIGVYLLDGAEVFFALNPSPFQTPVFLVGFIVVSLFIATSSGVLLAQGLVLSLYVTLLLRQAYLLTRWMFAAFALVFIIETFLFIAWA